MRILTDATRRPFRKTLMLSLSLGFFAFPEVAIAQRATASKTLTLAPAPTGLAVTGTSASATVTWQPVPGAVSYSVQRWKQDDPNCCKNGVTGLTVTSWTDAGPSREGFSLPGTYVFQVIALQADGTAGPALIDWQSGPTKAQASLEPLGELPSSGLMLPLLEPPADPGAQIVAVPLPVIVTVATLCNPIQKLPGPGPASFTLVSLAEPSMGAKWPAVPGAVAYVVERSVEGSNVWTLVGSTCGGPSPIRITTSPAVSVNEVFFVDLSGGIVPGTRYIYKIKAIGAVGETGWNSTRWTAPTLFVPTWYPTKISGSTVELMWRFQSTIPGNRWPDQFHVSSDYGLSQTTSCMPPICGLTVYGVPEGTNTFTLTARWVDYWSTPPKPVFATVSTTTTITIQP